MMLNCLRERIHPNYERAPGCKKGRRSRALNCLIFQRYCQNESRAVGTFLSYCPATGEKYRLALKLLWEVGSVSLYFVKTAPDFKEKGRGKQNKTKTKRKTPLLPSPEAS